MSETRMILFKLKIIPYDICIETDKTTLIALRRMSCT